MLKITKIRDTSFVENLFLSILCLIVRQSFNKLKQLWDIHINWDNSSQSC